VSFSSARRAASRVRVEANRARTRARETATLAQLRRPGRSIGYFGFAGHGNVGDDLIHDVYRLALPQRLVPMPLTRPAQDLIERAARRYPDALGDGFLVGGGTFIGRPEFRHALESAFAAWPGRRAVLVGAGVEDPGFAGVSSFTDTEEIARWRLLLGRFERASVRGPRSQAVLREAGVDLPVVGDPVLLFARRRGEPEDRLLGLNVADPTPMWGQNPGRVLDALAGYGREMARRGWRVLLVPMWRRDLGATAKVAARIGPAASVLDRWRDRPAFFEGVARCSVFTGVRLHSAVAAAACYVPAIALEYQPKCLDFQASIGRDRWVVRTDAVDVGTLVEMTEDLAARREQHSLAVEEAIAPLRERLTAELRQIAPDADAGRLTQAPASAAAPSA
jgi:hypothetical protein